MQKVTKIIRNNKTDKRSKLIFSELKINGMFYVLFTKKIGVRETLYDFDAFDYRLGTDLQYRKVNSIFLNIKLTYLI